VEGHTAVPALPGLDCDYFPSKLEFVLAVAVASRGRGGLKAGKNLYLGMLASKCGEDEEGALCSRAHLPIRLRDRLNSTLVMCLRAWHAMECGTIDYVNQHQPLVRAYVIRCRQLDSIRPCLGLQSRVGDRTN